MKKLINKELDLLILEQKIIKENFAVSKELEQLANELLSVWTKIWLRNKELDFGFEVWSDDFITPSDYSIFEYFLNSCRIRISFSEYLNAKGTFERSSNPKLLRYSITMKVEDYQIDRMKVEISRFKGDPNNKDDINQTNHYLTSNYTSTLVHELQHAFDSYRSDGNFSNDSQRPEYMNKKDKAQRISRKNPNDISREEFDIVQQYQDAYLKLPHEISARFSQTVRMLKPSLLFVSKTDGNSRIIKDWNTYYSEFKEHFWGWEKMNRKDKMSLIRRLAKYYQDSVDEFKANNK